MSAALVFNPACSYFSERYIRDYNPSDESTEPVYVKTIAAKYDDRIIAAENSVGKEEKSTHLPAVRKNENHQNKENTKKCCNKGQKTKNKRPKRLLVRVNHRKNIRKIINILYNAIF